MFSSNRRVTLFVSLVDGSNWERNRKPTPTGSSTPPSGGVTALTRSVVQESLPAVFGNVHVGTTGGAAAELAGKATKPTPTATAMARTTVDRLLVRVARTPWSVGLPTLIRWDTDNLPFSLGWIRQMLAPRRGHHNPQLD